MLSLETRQQLLHQVDIAAYAVMMPLTEVCAKVLKPALEQSRQEARDARGCRAQGGGLQQIRASASSSLRIGMGMGIDEELPGPFYRGVETVLEKRLRQAQEGILQLQRQAASSRPGLGQDGGVGVGPYGQPQRVGAQQLLELLKQQNDAFMRVAATAAETHRQVEALRERYLHLHALQQQHKDPSSSSSSSSTSSGQGRDSGNPFELADRREAAETRLQAQRMKSEISKSQQSLVQRQPQSQSLSHLGPGQAPAQSLAAGQSQGFGGQGFGQGQPTFGSPVLGGGLGSTTFGTPSLGGFGQQSQPQQPGAMSFGGGFSSQPKVGGGLNINLGNLPGPTIGMSQPSGSSLGKKKSSSRK